MTVNAHNLAHWNEVTAHHVVSPMYRTEDFRRGETVLDLDRDYWAMPPEAPFLPLSFTLHAVKEG